MFSPDAVAPSPRKAGLQGASSLRFASGAGPSMASPGKLSEVPASDKAPRDGSPSNAEKRRLLALGTTFRLTVEGDTVHAEHVQVDEHMLEESLKEAVIDPFLRSALAGKSWAAQPAFTGVTANGHSADVLQPVSSFAKGGIVELVVSVERPASATLNCETRSTGRTPLGRRRPSSRELPSPQSITPSKLSSAVRRNSEQFRKLRAMATKNAAVSIVDARDTDRVFGYKVPRNYRETQQLDSLRKSLLNDARRLGSIDTVFRLDKLSQTVLMRLPLHPITYVVLSMHAASAALTRYEYLQPIESSDIFDGAGVLVTFMIVFYVGYCYNRFEAMFGQVKLAIRCVFNCCLMARATFRNKARKSLPVLRFPALPASSARSASLRHHDRRARHRRACCTCGATSICFMLRRTCH